MTRDELKLRSKDGKEYTTTKTAMKMSSVIHDMLDEDMDESMDSDAAVLPILTVDGNDLQLVIEYCEYHCNNPAEEIEKPLKVPIETLLCEFDKNFLSKMSKDVFIRVTNAANYLHVKDLLELCCANVASSIRGKTPEQIRDMYNLPNDISPEEKEQIIKDNKWCEE